ncbi:hypothetical Protein YC6258_02898 [Gynuella sunshinyii YC6258]|uniref:Uncharacterized protein n=1 Tax=Gynuella sunshinyii YC6258 TaxID=1445510 RepID=A0A0C5VKV4_9GAMM|nr:hypothetical Protein YC6258_02898 [Gynuella sunshinyii YC6258]
MAKEPCRFCRMLRLQLAFVVIVMIVLMLMLHRSGGWVS